MATHFEDVYARILAVTNCQTQVELAEVLGIRQSSVSDAKRRGTVPAEWLITLLQLFGVNPDWILTGQAARFLEFTEKQPKRFASGMSPILRLCTACDAERGIWKRIDENRELLVCMQKHAPEFLERCIWVEGLIARQDAFLCTMRELLELPETPVGLSLLPRPWPGNECEFTYLESLRTHLLELSSPKPVVGVPWKEHADEFLEDILFALRVTGYRGRGVEGCFLKMNHLLQSLASIHRTHDVSKEVNDTILLCNLFRDLSKIKKHAEESALADHVYLVNEIEMHTGAACENILNLQNKNRTLLSTLVANNYFRESNISFSYNWFEDNELLFVHIKYVFSKHATIDSSLHNALHPWEGEDYSSRIRFTPANAVNSEA